MNEIEFEIYQFVKLYTSLYGYSPTMREIGEKVQRSPSTTLKWVHKLIADGWLTGEPNKPRTIRPA